MKHLRLFVLLMAASAVMLPFAACEQENINDGNEPTTEALAPDTLWVHAPYDTAAALDGRVWRCDEHTIVTETVDGNSLLRARGYVLTLTLLDDSTFHAELLLNVNHYMTGFPGTMDYRYETFPIDAIDWTPLVFIYDSTGWDNAVWISPGLQPDSRHAFVVRHIDDESFLLSDASNVGLEDEGITRYVFHRIHP